MTLKSACAAALLALFAAGCQPGPAKPASLESFKTGEFQRLDLDKDMMLPASAFVDAEGREHTFAEFAGKVIVYNIWAEWCSPCIEEMPTLAGLQKAFAGKDVVVIPIAAGYEKDRDSTRALLEKLVGSDLPFFYDDKFNVNADAKTGAFPSTIIYDRSGQEAARLEYPAKWDSKEAIALVQAVLDGAA